MKKKAEPPIPANTCIIRTIMPFQMRFCIRERAVKSEYLANKVVDVAIETVHLGERNDYFVTMSCPVEDDPFAIACAIHDITLKLAGLFDCHQRMCLLTDIRDHGSNDRVLYGADSTQVAQALEKVAISMHAILELEKEKKEMK